MFPEFKCKYPCSDCDPATPDVCTACWTGSDNPNFLMKYADGKQTCTPYCDSGFTTNGDPNKHCIACDVSCKACFDNGKVGDVKECIECSTSHPFREARTNLCFVECEENLYISSPFICSRCALPCRSCVDNEAKCLSCYPRGPTTIAPDYTIPSNLPLPHVRSNLF